MYKSKGTKTSQTSSYRSFPLCEVVREDTEISSHGRELPLTIYKYSTKPLCCQEIYCFSLVFICFTADKPLYANLTSNIRINSEGALNIISAPRDLRESNHDIVSLLY